jgi:hypothetical protein
MPHEAFAALLESDVLLHVFTLWQNARTDARVPSWAAIAAFQDPIVAEYGWGWHLDPATDQLISFVMGPRLRELYGEDSVGRTAREFYYGPIAPFVENNMRQVIGTPCLHRAGGFIAWREGRADMGERMVLPIRFASDDKPDALLGATVFDYTMLGSIAPATPPAQDLVMMPLYPEDPDLG